MMLLSVEKENISIFDHMWQIIANPNALSNSCYRQWEEIAAKLDDLQLDYQFHITEEVDSVRKLIKKLCQEGHRHIMALGGDGTVCSIVNAIFDAGVPIEEVYLAVLPLGTGNDWCRTHNYPRLPLESINIFLRGQFVKHDIGLVECIRVGEVFKRQYFINIAGFGFDAAIIHKTASKRARVSNKYIYLLTLLKVLFSHKAQRVNIKTESEETDENLFSVAIGNCRYNGNGMQQLPMANPTDGYFDMMQLKSISPFKVLKNIKNLYKGNLEQIPEIRFSKAKELYIKADPYILGEIEGDVLPAADYHIRMIPGALHMLTAL